MIYIFVGPPGSGKGTQAKRLCEQLSLAHLSTGDLLRGAIAQGTELGLKAKAFMDQGALVPDDLVFGLLKEKMNQSQAKGFLLDGFPRNLPQAKTLSELISSESWQLGKVVNFSIPSEVLVNRLVGRRSCPGCGSVFHVETQMPRVAGVCDQCGTALVHRSDDQESVIRRRIETFLRETAPILEFYRVSGSLVEVAADQSPVQVSEALLKVLRS
jgi:adenylate kinase